MRWVKASEQKPERGKDINARYDAFPCIIHFYNHNSAIWNKTDETWIYEYDFDRLQWINEYAHEGVTAEVVQGLYDAFANWYHDDGSYDSFLFSEAMKAMHEYASLVSASKDEEIARLKEEIKGWIAYKHNIDDALNSGDGSYRP